ncbi:MAG TPA: glycoside hydrolase family 3 C-terminal domain-containing protein [Sphingobium sp.]
MRKFLLLSAAFIAPHLAHAAPEQDAEKRAAAVEAQMTAEERVVLTKGIFAMVLGPGVKLPDDAVIGSGYVPGIPRLDVPSLKETDASLGVAYLGGARNDGGATPLPSGLALGSTWNPALLRQGGATIGAEAKAKGFNVMLAGGINLMFDPRNGRTFEYLSEDPLLSGTLGGEAIAGIQSNNMISTIKHFAFNGQETLRSAIDARVSEANGREGELLAFKIAIERGNPGSVMCAYNKVNGSYACDSDWLLNKVLKQDWGYKGFVMSDWGAVPSTSTALNGLDQQSGSQIDKKPWLGKPLFDAAAKDPAYAARVKDMNRRILYSIYAHNLDKDPPVKKKIDAAAGLNVAESVAKEGIVLLRNVNNALPLAASAKKIAVIGNYADIGVLSGGGSSQVQMDGGPAVSVSLGGEGPMANFIQETYHRSSPLNAIRKRAKGATVTFTHSNYPFEAAAAARNADVAILFAYEWRTEGFDSPDLTLPRGQDALIEAVTAANPNTIVVLQTGGPVLMPWLDKTAAVLEAWYPGGRGGEAITSILFGDTNPSGRLPVSFPASTADLPRPKIDGWAPGLNSLNPTAPQPTEEVRANYDIEGSDLGYRWYAREGKKTLFPFGYGLSYTSFAHSGLKTSGKTASFTVKNSGQRAGADVAQLYLVSAAGKKKHRLLGYEKLSLEPGQSRTVKLTIDPRLLASWDNGGWLVQGGDYEFALGSDAENLSAPVKVRLTTRRWKD